MRYRVVIFDLDGTLLDTLTDIGTSANAVLTSFGFPIHPMDAYRRFVGEGMLMLFTRALPEAARQEETIRTCVQRMGVEYGRRWNDTSRPYPQIPELLAALAERRIRLAVLSNKPQPFTEKLIAAHFSSGCFERVYGQRPEVPRKPDPAGAIQIAAELDVAPAECIYLGDSAVDMQTALRGGMFPAGALWGFRSRDELETQGAKAIISQPLDLLGVV